MDFYQIKEKSGKNGLIEIYPDFKVCRSKDLMVKGKSFYAIWDEEKNLWSTDEYDVQRLIDKDLEAYKEKIKGNTDGIIKVKYMRDFSNNIWIQFRNYLSHISDNAHQLDDKIIFMNVETSKKDYISKKLPYPLDPNGSTNAYDELIGTLYDKEEKEKIEWAIGSIISGDSKYIQKFLVLYGEAGTGKSTMLNIIQKLFEGYYTTFEAKALASSNNAFSTEAFKHNPLVAIQHDGDLSKIEDNTKLNSIISHEEMTINEKYKPSYTSKINCFLFMGTNKPVKITDAKSGIIRRLIDVKPSGKKLPARKYQTLMSQIDFELGSIAYRCLCVYRKLGKNYYSNYRPLEMILQTDVFFNFMEMNYYIFKEEDGVSLTRAYEMYKLYCEDSLVEFKLPRHKFREELKNYFKNFDDIKRIDGKQVRSYYSKFRKEKFKAKIKEEEKPLSLDLDKKESILDDILKDCPAQYAVNDIPHKKWSDVDTTLSSIDTSKVHYVKVPKNHIVIDFDIKDEKGNKSLELNLEEASKWPPTYCELSKGGNGVHLHYIYTGDPEKLSRLYAEGIEIKVFTGNSSLRRKVSKCNNIPIATINSGLPLKGEKMINFDVVKSERHLRNAIKQNLRKEVHPGTKPSIDFIYDILEKSYESGLHYDVTDMRPDVMTFAANSTHKAQYCLNKVSKMKFKSEEPSESTNKYKDDRYVFYDIEVKPNLLLVSWKFEGKDSPCISMFNPSPKQIEELFYYKLIGFNNRRYDNHILYGRYNGYTIPEIYELSKRIVNGSKNAMFSEAYNISFIDVYDASSKKQSLKKWEIELGIHHQEMEDPWDQPIDESQWERLAEYCENDVRATEAVFNHIKSDFVARQILADLSGLSINDTTNSHTTRIIFGNERNPQKDFVYTDLSEMFPGYTFDNGISNYRGENPGEGGYVYSNPGMYGNVALLDIASMHPTSIEQLNLFGPYTKRFSDLKRARIEIKHKNFDVARKMFDGKLEKYLIDESNSEALSYALKIAINSVYGLTSAKFPNKFKDERNIDNIVAKRGALFMIDLKHEVEKMGYKVAHIKTDSIKIPDADYKIIDFVKQFGKKYGYEFEHESTYEKMCLINDAVYIAYVKSGKHEKEWYPTGAQFAEPYVFKTLFSKEKIVFKDLCFTKSVTSALYLDMNENLPEGEHNYHFVGKTGEFCPMKPGSGGGLLMREKDGKYYCATGTKGYRWMESEHVKLLHLEDKIDYSYYQKLVDDAVKVISKYCDFEWFALSEENYIEIPF